MSGEKALSGWAKRIAAAACMAVACVGAYAQLPASRVGPAAADVGTPALPAMPQNSTPVPPTGGARVALPVGAVSSVGPGDALQITVYGQPELSAVITVNVEGEIMVPVVGTLAVRGSAPADIARRIAQGLRNKNYLQDPQVSVEVLEVRSQMTSVLGEVQRPGRYPLQGRLTLLELLALAGGLKETADDTAVLLRKSDSPYAVEPGASQQRLELYVGGRQSLSRAVQDVPLQSGDVVYIGPAKRFYIYGEVNNAGAYPMEDGLTVMRALTLGGGLSQRASEKRISVHRKLPGATEETVSKARLTDTVLPGDVIYVDERFF